MILSLFESKAYSTWYIYFYQNSDSSKPVTKKVPDENLGSKREKVARMSLLNDEIRHQITNLQIEDSEPSELSSSHTDTLTERSSISNRDIEEASHVENMITSPTDQPN
jgi:hypothetical protein